jgi:hypothetical protein
MKRTRWSAAIAGVAVAAAVTIPGTISSAAPGDAQLTIVHGLGPAPNSVDIYVDGGLVAGGVDYGETLEAELPGGTYTVEICGAVPAPPDPLPAEGCEISANFPNGGVDITVANNTSYTVVAQFAGTGQTTGRPTVIAYVNDLDCVEPGQGRISFLHAATAPIVDVLFDAAVVFDNVAPETNPPPSIERAGGTVDITMLVEEATGGDDLVETQVTDLPIRNSSAVILVGNPQQDAGFDILSVDYPVEDCVPVTTTTAPTTTTTVPPAVTPVVVTPVFTG